MDIPKQAVDAAAAHSSLHLATQAACARFEQETGNKPNPLEVLLFGRMARSALEAAAPAIREAERQRIRQLAEQHNARADMGPYDDEGIPFADLIGDGSP